MSPSQDDILKAKVFKEFEDENSPDHENQESLVNSQIRSAESDIESEAELFSLKDIFVMDA